MSTVAIWFVAAVFAAGGILDIWLLLEKGKDATISATLYKLAQRWPIIPFAIGILGGHLFWTQ